MDGFEKQSDFNMEAIISRIIKADKAASAGMEEARQERKNADMTIAGRKAAMREDYAKRAEDHIKKFEEFERLEADKEFQKSHGSNNRQMVQLQDARRGNFDEWVDDIVSRVLS